MKWKDSMEKISLFGAGGHAKVVADIIYATGAKIGAIYDDKPRNEPFLGKTIASAPLQEKPENLIITVGDNSIRKKISERYDTSYATVVYPSSIISPSSKIGLGTVVMQGSVIQADASIGNHCIINTGATVDHDCNIADFVHIAPNATLCGGVEVGEGTLVGAGSVITPYVKIGKWCKIAAGSAITTDVPDFSIVFGNPCGIKNLNDPIE